MHQTVSRTGDDEQRLGKSSPLFVKILLEDISIGKVGLKLKRASLVWPWFGLITVLFIGKEIIGGSHLYYTSQSKEDFLTEIYVASIIN